MMRTPLYGCLLLACILSTGNLLPISADPPADDLAKELERLPPVPAEKAGETFVLQHGFRLVQVAAEPLVSDPIDACFDADGRLYVAEMHGYPYSSEPRAQQPEPIGKKDACIVRRLVDTDDDGVFDSSTVFASGISWVTSVCCYRDGVFVLAPDTLYYFKDEDGDGRADVKEVIYTGFSRANVQGLANNLKWGLDHKIYGATGSNGAELVRDGEPLINLGRRDFRFDPRTLKLEPVAGAVQFGHSMDDWGHRFLCSNSDHIRQVVFPLRYLERNPSLSTSGAVRSIAREGGAAPVFRRSPAEPWRIVRTRRRANDPDFAKRLPPTELVPIGFFTSATGVTIYRGDAYPEEFHGNAFIGDVGGNLIHRKILTPNGAAFTAERADRDVEFATSTDTWFRPVNFVNAPDGTLYVLDMYRETIEHPVSIPEDIKAHVDLESGDDRGRIYRLEAPGFVRRKTPRLSQMQSVDLVAYLGSPNAWHRDTSHRLLWERQDKSVVPLLRAMLRGNEFPLARLHALWSLQGLGALDVDDYKAAFADSHAEIRAQAVQISERWAAQDPLLRREALQLVDDDAFAVRLQLAFSLGEWNTPDATSALLALSQTCGTHPDWRTAWLSSASSHARELLKTAVREESAANNPLMAEAARTLGLSGSEDEAREVIDAVLQQDVPMARQIAWIGALADGLALRGRPLIRVAASGQSNDLSGRLERFFSTVTEIAGNGELPEADRIRSVAVLTHAPLEVSFSTLRSLTSPAVPISLQSAAIQTLSRQGSDQGAELLLESFAQFSPGLQKQVIDELLKRKSWTTRLLGALETGDLKSVALPREQQDILLNHPDKEIQTEAKKLLGAAVSTDRVAIIARYREAIDRPADAARGETLFRKHCLACHQLGKDGHNVGPALASVKNKSPDDLLIAILDPNREAQANYLSYTAVTEEGKVLTGIIVAESNTAITLRQAEGKEDVILREQLEILKANGVSLMPVGFEKEFPPDDLNALIGFIKALPAPADPASTP